MKLTPKQKAFADYYIESLQTVDSYLKAGYKVKSNDVARANANRLLSNAIVRAYIGEKMLQKDNERIASQDEVLELLTRMARGEIEEETVSVYRDKSEIVKKQVAPRDRNKALELLGKRYALFTEKVDLSGDVGLHINVDYGDELEDS